MTILVEEEPDSAPALSDLEFGLFQRMIRWEAGIHLSDLKKPLLVSRLGNRLRELGLRSFGAYYRRVQRDPEERVHMLDRVSTNKTEFFRQPAQFEFIERVILREWAAAPVPRRRPVRAWSAGCSTGQEAYTLAAVLLTHLPPASAVGLEIVGTDISTRVLESARQAVWPLEDSADIPPRFLGHFLKGHGAREGSFKAGPELRRHVRFEHGNLVDEATWPAHSFDLIFCRNVLIYFDAPTKARVLDGLLQRLEPDGHLFLGHAESLNLLGPHARSVGPTIYRRTAADRGRP
jgi:chemotaxis protein methyltransferase CheR